MEFLNMTEDFVDADNFLAKVAEMHLKEAFPQRKI
jgi:hypothetical protein